MSASARRRELSPRSSKLRMDRQPVVARITGSVTISATVATCLRTVSTLLDLFKAYFREILFIFGFRSNVQSVELQCASSWLLRLQFLLELAFSRFDILLFAWRTFNCQCPE